ncbi:MAG: STAS domain-containing protein [Gammaproteobacteria bacterium]
MTITADFDIETERATIRVDDILNFDRVMEFRAAYEQQPWQQAAITVDLRECPHLDSAALGVLLLMKSQLGKADGEITLLVGNSEVAGLLAAVHFEKKFTIE